MSLRNPITFVVLLQVLIVFAGWMLIAGFMKAHGYPADIPNWPGVVMPIRRVAVFLLLIPAGWGAWASWDLFWKADGWLPTQLHVLIGVAITLGILSLMAVGVCCAMRGPHSGLGW